MKYEVWISERAEENLDLIFEYLDQNWPTKVKEDFKEKLLKQVGILRQNPYIFPDSNLKKGVRKCLISKQNAMYYRINRAEVEIITIQDTRQDPKNLIL